jgi:flavin reductase (DIM6/NTAB) family NADH-FMN oxidoreductase RutF/DNA-binding IclR family transcriptional regulator
MSATTTAPLGLAKDARYFRDILGNVPTSVVAITSVDDAGEPIGMAVGTFTSVSLDPPLVAFLPDRSSSTFPKIRESGRFCANILTASQENVCRSLSRKGADKFASLKWSMSEFGTPHIEGAIGWIDCSLNEIHEAGDHYIAVGSVEHLQSQNAELPLIFFRGGYGRFASTSLTAPAETELFEPLRIVDQALPVMRNLSDELGVECLASGIIGDQLVLLGNSVSSATAAPPYMRLGQRMPFRPPLALPLIAWQDQTTIDQWVKRSEGSLDQQELLDLITLVRERGWSLVLGSPEQVRFERSIAALPLRGATREQSVELTEATSALKLDNYEPAKLDRNTEYSVRLINAPVFDAEGNVPIVLSLYQLPKRLSGSEVDRYRDRLQAAAHEVTRIISEQPIR